MHKIVRSEGPISKDEKTEQHNHALKRTSVKEYNRNFFNDNQDGVLDPFTGFTLLLTMICIINNIVNIDKTTQNISLDNVYCWER